MSTTRKKSRWGVVSLPFHMPTLGTQRLAKWLSRMRREDVIARHGSSLCSEHVDGHCFKARSLLRRDYARGDGSYMRKPGRTLKATAIPTRLAHAQSVEWRCSSVSAWQRRREEHEREKVSVCAVFAIKENIVTDCDREKKNV